MTDMHGVYRDSAGDLLIGLGDHFGLTTSKTFWRTILDGSRLNDVIAFRNEKGIEEYVLPLEFFD